MNFVARLVLFPILCSAQFVPPPSGLKTAIGGAGIKVRYKQVPPGTCEQSQKVKSFSGYSDIGPNEHIFWWFFEAKEDPLHNPLTIWLNGGPGASSMNGLFRGNGPCFLEKKYGQQDPSPIDNPYAWTKATNMLYIDQPSLTGFSYSNPALGCRNGDGDVVPIGQNSTCPPNTTLGTFSKNTTELFERSTPQAAEAFYKVLQGFMGAFPQYSKCDVVFATESYGGHYGPVFSEYIMKQNERHIHGTIQIRISALLIINGLSNALLQYPAYYKYARNNPYDVPMLNQSFQQKMSDQLFAPGACMDQLNFCNSPNGTDKICFEADDTCYKAQNLALQFSKKDQYDIRYLDPSPFPNLYYEKYLNLPHVQEAIGAFVNFTPSASEVFNAFLETGDTVRNLTIMEDMKSLVEKRGIPMVLMYGDADYICNWIGGEAVADAVGIEGFEKAGYVDVQTTDGVAHGQVRQKGNFAFVRAFESGHMVPFFQPVMALEVLKRIIGGKDVATGKNKIGERTVGPLKSEFREGNGTVILEPVAQGAVYNYTTGGPNL